MIKRRVKVRRKPFGLVNIWVWEVSFAGIRWGSFLPGKEGLPYIISLEEFLDAESFLTWEEAMKSANEKAQMLATTELKARVHDSIIQQGMLRCSINE